MKRFAYVVAGLLVVGLGLAAAYGVIRTRSAIRELYSIVTRSVDMYPPGFNDIAGRQPMSCAGPALRIIIAGQSNASNEASGPLRQGYENVLNLNIHDGHCYVARDPLLGPDGKQANFATALGNLLVERGNSKVILIPIAVSGTRIEPWAPAGFYHQRLLAAAMAQPDLIIWQHGEAQNPAHGAKEGEDYTASLRAIVKALRVHGQKAPVMVSQTTVCGGPPEPIIRAAQRAAVDQDLGILLGPDTDQLGPEFRRDDCHFNERGADAVARLWADAIASVKF